MNVADQKRFQASLIALADELRELLRSFREDARPVDLDQPIRVMVNGKEYFKGMVKRRGGAIWQSLQERKDPSSVATSIVRLKF